MRVIVVHNRYSSRVPSGENLSVDDEVVWLRKAGVAVHVHDATNDDVLEGGLPRRAAQAVWAPWSIPAQRRLGKALDAFAPDVVHVHNLFPMLTGSVVAVPLRRRIPVVWTVHNHRTVCVAGTHFRDGRGCYDCQPGWRVAGVRHRCYRDSFAASALVTGATALFRGVARRGVTALAISESIRQWLLTEAGFGDDKVDVKYNAVARYTNDRALPPASSRAFLYAGAANEHKGVRLLLDAWRSADLGAHAELRFAGDGPLADEVRAAAATDRRITMLGPLAPEAVRAEMATVRAIVVPSLVRESFGRAAAEGLASGRPVITTGLGGLGEIVDRQSGWMTGTDTGALAEALAEAARDDAAVNDRGVAAQARYERLFSPEATTRALVGIYERCVQRARRQGGEKQ